MRYSIITALFVCSGIQLALHQQKSTPPPPSLSPKAEYQAHGFALNPSSLLLPINRPQQNPQQALPLPFRFVLGEIVLVILDVLLQLGVRTKGTDRSAQAPVVDQVARCTRGRVSMPVFPLPEKTDRSAYENQPINPTIPSQSQVSTPLIIHVDQKHTFLHCVTVPGTRPMIPTSPHSPCNPANAPPPLSMLLT